MPAPAIQADANSPLQDPAAPLFSIVILTFNRRDLCAQAVASALSQPGDDYEVVVIDDGSVDGTAGSLAEQFAEAAASGRLRIVVQPNSGEPAARQAGVRQARGRYIAFLDSDDLWFPWTLDVYRRSVLASNQPASLNARPALHPIGSPSAIAEYHASSDDIARFDDLLSASRTENLFYGAGGTVFRRDLAMDLPGGFDRGMNCWDIHLILHLGEAPGCVVIRSPCTFAYRQHEASLSRGLERTANGWRLICRLERENAYSAGEKRRADRWRIMSHHLRHFARQQMAAGRRAAAWDLYRLSLRMNLAEHRYGFLIRFPIRLALSMFTRPPKTGPAEPR